MNDRTPPKLPKWSFFLGDLLLVVLAWVILKKAAPLNAWETFGAVISVAVGAWLCATPFLLEYRAALKFAENEELNSAIVQIQNLELVAGQISAATAQWQAVQEQSSKTAAAAKELAELMTAEAKAFGEFLQQANDREKAHLRLELEKLRRSEGDWLQILIRLMDHVYALYGAGVRSAQPALIAQLTNFQNACRDQTRRIGLVPFSANASETFDSKLHQLMDEKAPPPAGARIAETIATGYTYQGQLLRRALVTLHPEPKTAEVVPPESSAANAEQPTSTQAAPGDASLPGDETVTTGETAEPGKSQPDLL